MADKITNMGLPGVIKFWENRPGEEGRSGFTEITSDCTESRLVVLESEMGEAGATIEVKILARHDDYLTYSVKVSGFGWQIAQALKVLRDSGKWACLPCAQGRCGSCTSFASDSELCDCRNCGGGGPC